MRDTDDDFWDLMKELDFKFEEKFKVSLSDYDKAAQYINDEYFKKRSSNNAELNDEGKTEEVSPRTLRYYWSRDKDKKTDKENNDERPNPRKLDIICVSMGYDNWNCFKEITRRAIKIDSYFDPKDFKVENMAEGYTFRFGWFPQYFVELKYLGNYIFEITSRSYNLRQRFQLGQKITAYGFGLIYAYEVCRYKEEMPNGEKETCINKETENKIFASGCSLYPGIFFKPKDYKIEDNHSALIICS